MASSFEGLFNSSFLKISPPMQQQQEAQEGSTPTGPATAPATTPEPSHQRDHHRDYRANAVQPSGKKTSSHCSFCWDVLSLELKHASSQCRKRQKYCFYCRIGGHSDANCTRQNKDSECGFCRDILGAKRTHSAANCPRIKNYCFHCRKNGHCDATCGLQRLCEVCWKMGHATKNCRYASGSNNASSTSEESSRRQTEVIDSGMTNNPWDHSSSSSSLEMNAQPTVSPAFCRHCDRRGHATRDCTFQKNRRTESKVFEKKATQEIGHTSTENAVKFEQPRDPRPPRQLDYRSGNNNSPQYHSRDRDERPGQAAATMSTSLDALKKSHSLHENDGWGGAPYSHREDINNTRPESLYQSSNANGNSQSSEIASSSHNVQGQERVAQKTSTHIHFPTDPRVRKSSSQAPPATLDSSSDRGASIRAEAVIKGESFSVQKSLPRPWTEPSLQQNAQSDAEVIIIDEPTISSSSHIRSFTSPTNRINVSLSGPPQKPTSVLPPSQTQPRSTDKPVATPTVRKTEQISPSTPVRQTGNPQESPDSERVSLASLAKTVAAPPSTEGSASKRKRSSTGPKTTLLSKRKPFNGLLPSAQITSITHVDELDDENEDDETDLQTQTSPSPSATQTVSRGQARESLVPRQSSNQTASIKSRPSIGSDPADTPPMVDYTAILAIVTDLEKTRFDIRDQRGYYQRMILTQTGKLRDVVRLLITGDAKDMDSIRDQIESCESHIEDLENERNLKMKEKDSEQAKLLRSIRDLVNSMGNPSVRMQRSHSSISNDTASTSLKRPRADSITQIVSQHVAAQVDPVTAVPAQIEINYRPAYEKRISIGSHGDDSVTASSAEPTPSPANDLTLRLGRGPYPPEPISHINRDSVVQYSELIGNFPDKPRSFLLPQSTVGPLQSLAFSSTIKKNELSVWDLSRNRSIHTFSLETEYMPEDMCWLSENVMAICSASRNPNRVGLDDSYQLTLIYDIDYSSSSTFSCKKRHILENERSKGLTAVRGLPQTRESTRWVTAGMDKSLCSWSFNGDFDADEKGYTPITYSSVHEEHTARVLALYFDTNRNILYSGGYDGRIVGWSMEHNHLMDSIDKTKRVVRDILPVSQHILLISHMDREREFDVIDTRVGSVVVNFGSKKVLTSADEKLERKRACHQRANIHPDGHLVSFGDFNSSGVNIWDLRKPHQAPILLQVHDQLISKTTSNVVTKTLVAPFYQDPNTSKNYLFSVGSDKKLFKIDLDRIYL